MLLNRGALLHRDHNGRNPLHLAAASGYTQTIELLHSVHSHLLDQIDKDGVSYLGDNFTIFCAVYINRISFKLNLEYTAAFGND